MPAGRNLSRSYHFRELSTGREDSSIQPIVGACTPFSSFVANSIPDSEETGVCLALTYRPMQSRLHRLVDVRTHDTPNSSPWWRKAPASSDGRYPLTMFFSLQANRSTRNCGVLGHRCDFFTLTLTPHVLFARGRFLATPPIASKWGTWDRPMAVPWDMWGIPRVPGTPHMFHGTAMERAMRTPNSVTT